MGYSLLFILGLHLSSGKFPRDHPATIKRRFISVVITSTLSLAHVFTYIYKQGYPVLSLSSYDLSAIFVRIDGTMNAILTSVLLTLVLYFGVLIDDLFSGRIANLLNFRQSPLCNWIVLRNLIVAPLAEELIFRACIMFHLLPLFSSCTKVCIISSLFFSVAHFHHMFERIREGYSWSEAVQRSIFQVFYTTLFGIYSGFLMLRTGNVLAAVVCHALCNFMGLPDPLGAAERSQLKWGKLGPLLILGFHLFGLIAWAFLLYPITSPNRFLGHHSQCQW